MLRTTRGFPHLALGCRVVAHMLACPPKHTAMAKGGTGPSTCGHRSLASVLRGVPNIFQSVVALAGIIIQTAASASTSTATSSSAVGVNQGLLVTGSVHFGVVPVPNLCVELRGYDPPLAEETSPSISTSGTPHPGQSNGGVAAAASVTAGHSWHGWGEGKPKFLELQRTGESDGSFVFVTPKSGLLLVLAAYPHGGENPIVRVFPHDPHSRDRGKGSTSNQGATGRGPGGGEASAFGADSGRVQMHIDVSEATHAPEVMWSASAADRGKDRSPCARREAAVAEASGSLGAVRGGGEDDAAAAAASAAGETVSSARERWPRGEELMSRIYHGIGGGGDKVHQAMSAVTDSFRWSRQYFGELGSDCWEASAAVYASLCSGLAKTGQRAHQSALAASAAATEWSWTAQLTSRLALLSPTTMLTSWHWQRLASTHATAWLGEASAPLLSWLEQQSSVDLTGWWSVWWVRVGAIALALGILQEVFVFVYKRFSSAAAVVGVTLEDRRCSRSPHQDQDSAGTTKTLVGTFHSSDGTVCQLDFGKLGHPEEPATADRKRKGDFGAGWGGGRCSSRSKLANGIGEQEGEGDGTDEFSTMFRALSQTSCSVTGFTDKDDVGGGATSNVVVVTQSKW